MDEEQRARYWKAVETEDKWLDERLTDIRGRQDTGMISIRQAADERIVAMEQHLDAVRELRRRHLEGGQPR
jgi:hypothetical protein